MTVCAQIKARMRLREVARLAGIDLPDRDGVKFCSPFRSDSNPSCTIQRDRMRDWSRGETLDCIAFFAAAKGTTNAVAIQTLAAHLGITTGKRDAIPTSPARSVQPIAGQVTLDDRKPSDDDFAAILRTRKLPPEAAAGLLLAHEVGVLRFATIGGFPSWIVTDERRTVAQARRLDGKPFPPIGYNGERKAHTLRGSIQRNPHAWLPGLALRLSEARLRHLRSMPLVLTEGAPDLLCAYALLAVLPLESYDVQPVAMLGTGPNIGTEALVVMTRRPCIIIAHGDKAGRAAARRWKDQLRNASCLVKLREMPDGCDLNDAVSAHGLYAMRGAIEP